MGKLHNTRVTNDTLTKARQIVAEMVFGASDDRRAGGVRALATSRQWFSLLPAIVDPSKAEAEVVVLSPFEYVLRATRDDADKLTDFPVVDGDLVLTQKSGMIMVGGKEVCESQRLSSLPRAVVRGGMKLIGLTKLKRTRCSVVGEFRGSLCRSLSRVEGEVFGNTVIRGCGIEGFGAGFRCSGDLHVCNCEKLSFVNSEVDGDFTAVDCGILRTGSGFRVGGSAVFSGCENLSEVKGLVLGAVRVNGTKFSDKLNFEELSPRRGVSGEGGRADGSSRRGQTPLRRAVEGGVITRGGEVVGITLP
jgi:hypothetical protein